MGRSTKPRRAYNPNKRCALTPMMKTSRDNLALSLHIAVEALIAAPSIDTYNSLSKKIFVMDSALQGNHAPIEAAKSALNRIEERHQRMGKVGVASEEEKALRDASCGLDALLAKIPVEVMKAAKHRAALFCQAYGIE